MIRFTNLSELELAQNGIAFETSAEANQFIEIIQREREIRIGRAISKRVDEAALDEFEKCCTMAERGEWMKKNCPNYQVLVNKENAKMEHEIREFKNKIPGVIRNDGG